jgi:hypothetical protein
MKSQLLFLLLSCLTVAATQGRQQVPEALVSFQPPEGWEHETGLRVTRAQRLQMLGKEYGPEDEQVLDFEMQFYMKHNYDPDVEFDPETAVASDFAVESHTYYGAFSRWVWKNGWCVGEKNLRSYMSIGPVCKVAGDEMELIEAFDPGDPRMPFEKGTGFVFERNDQGPYQFDFRYYVYNIVVGETCYQIRIGGLTHTFEEEWPEYEEMLKSVRFTE